MVDHGLNHLRLSTVLRRMLFLGSAGGLVGRPSGRVGTVALGARSLYEVDIPVLVPLDAAGPDQTMDPLARDPKQPSRFRDAQE
jgi:hypothetical protein